MGKMGESSDPREDVRGAPRPGTHVIEERPAPAGVVLLALAGEFDLAAAPAARARFGQAGAGRPRGVVLDLAGVTFADSSALRELLLAHAALQAEGVRLVLAAVPANIERLLDVTRARDLLELAPAVEQALERVAG